MTDSDKNMHIEPIPLAISLGSVSWSMRAYFSSYHLWAAKYFSELATEIENDYKESSRDVRLFR